uniref:Uncharacterized protein n=1 Tax=Siphoviridae sp. ctkzC12 TaxID=2826446 RepID=A0A8S5LVG4_9CAUD|nr:MAG TPA: hypothetical protein [Siphoviridae sp. ctkzC12]
MLSSIRIFSIKIIKLHIAPLFYQYHFYYTGNTTNLILSVIFRVIY